MGELDIKEQLLNLILEYYNSHKWSYTQSETDSTVIEVLRPTWSLSEIKVNTIICGTSVTVYTQYPYTATQDRYPKLLELMANINNIEVLGNLELNMDSGVLRYKSHTVWGHYTMPNRQVLSKYLNAGVRVFDKYSIGIAGILSDSLSVGEALELTDD